MKSGLTALEDEKVQGPFVNDSSLRLFRTAIYFFGHLTISTLGVGMAAAMLFYAFKPALSPFLSPFALRHDLPLMIPFFPIQSLVALVVGFTIARKKGAFWSTEVHGGSGSSPHFCCCLV
jgi:hypothetical protein